MLHGQVEGPERSVAANDLFTICLSIWIMRGGFIPFLLIMTSLLTGCGPEAPVVAGAVVVASGASLPVFHLYAAGYGGLAGERTRLLGGEPRSRRAVLPATRTRAGAPVILHAIVGRAGLLGESGEAARSPAADRRWTVASDRRAGKAANAMVAWALVSAAVRIAGRQITLPPFHGPDRCEMIAA